MYQNVNRPIRILSHVIVMLFNIAGTVLLHEFNKNLVKPLGLLLTDVTNYKMNLSGGKTVSQSASKRTVEHAKLFPSVD